MDDNVVHTGCSGFYNKLWKGIFYPDSMPGKEWFAFYCTHFKTFEINATFYKFPTARVMQNWYNRAPENFIYAIKAPKIITHLKRFVDCQEEIRSFYQIINDGLAEKLGPVLFQLPPSFSYNEERLQLITAALNPDYKNVVEFRHESWWRGDVFNALAEKGITFCSVSYPGLPDRVIDNSALGYIRLHGNTRLFYSEYTTTELDGLYTQIASKKFEAVYVFFNNTASSAGIINAVDFKRIILQPDNRHA